jgi:intracellular multiplication protein IcmJ
MRGAGSGAVKPPTESEIKKTLKRDDHSCRFCGFRSTQYQRVIPTGDGLVTACGFCEQVTALERAGLMGGGVLIWLPEITQAELNHIARAIYVARADDESPMADAATRALDALMLRRADAKKRLGSDDPLLLATILHENLSESERKTAIRKLDGVRLMPLDKYVVRSKKGDVNGFPRIVRFWRSPEGPFAKLPVGEWQTMFAKFAA